MAASASATNKGESPEAGGKDPFALLGLERRFDLSPAQVQRAYLQHVARLHPDINGTDEASEDAELAGPAPTPARLHEAKALLEHDESRANVLLLLLDGATKEQDKSLPESFLMEIMEVREQVESALATGDAVAREHWRGWALEQRAVYVLRLTPQFAALSREVLGTVQHTVLAKQARRELNAWRYVERLIEQLDPMYDPSHADFSGQGGTVLDAGDAKPR